MRKLNVFEMVSLDGFIADANGDMSWAHKHDPENDEFVASNSSGEGPLLFGRRTYEMMASFWPTPMAAQLMPHVAERMNARPKLVVSRTLEAPTWNDTEVIRGDLLEKIAALKAEPGPDLTILGSASIVRQLAVLVDRWSLVINPIALGSGLSLFADLAAPVPLHRTSTRAFANGNVLVTYEPLNQSA